MSGHSKWSTIKRQKGANDAKRGQLFTKLANAITIAVKEGGGGDPNSNFRLRLAIEKARLENMPKDNIDRAIERGLGKTGEAQIETVVYEGFGPSGVAVLVEALTDNRNRTTPEVKMTYDKYGGTFAQPGTVNWQFKAEGQLVVTPNAQNKEELLLAAIEAGASDVLEEDDVLVIYTPHNELHTVKQTLEGQGITITDAKTIMRPNQPVAVPDAEDAEKIIHFLERLEDLADVQAVYTNAQV